MRPDKNRHEKKKMPHGKRRTGQVSIRTASSWWGHKMTLGVSCPPPSFLHHFPSTNNCTEELQLPSLPREKHWESAWVLSWETFSSNKEHQQWPNLTAWLPSECRFEHGLVPGYCYDYNVHVCSSQSIINVPLAQTKDEKSVLWFLQPSSQHHKEMKSQEAEHTRRFLKDWHPYVERFTSSELKLHPIFVFF